MLAQWSTVGLSVSPTQRIEVKHWLRRRDLAPRLRERLEMVKAVGLGQTVPQIAQWSGRTERTVRHWLRRYAQGAWLPSLTRPGPGGRPQRTQPTAARRKSRWRRRLARWA
jgi:transposase